MLLSREVEVVVDSAIMLHTDSFAIDEVMERCLFYEEKHFKPNQIFGTEMLCHYASKSASYCQDEA